MQSNLAQCSRIRMPCAPAAALSQHRSAVAVRRLPRPALGAIRCQAAARQGEVTIRFENGAAVLSLGPTTAVDTSKTCSEEEELKTLAGQFDRWNEALQTGDPEAVAALYMPDAVLLPTVSNQVRTDHEGKVDYFTTFLKLKPQGTINQSHVRFLSPERNVGINSGVYTFDVEKDGKHEKVQARYSFVYRKVNGEWLITEHHSSAMPEPVADPLDTVAAQFVRWNQALQTGDPEKVASLYAPNSVLLPTVSNKVRTDHAGKVDYFTSFLKLQPRGSIDESIVRFLTPAQDLASNSGIYTFRLVKDGQPTQVQARYSFLYRKINGEWLITEHHSSAMPEPVAEQELTAAGKGTE